MKLAALMTERPNQAATAIWDARAGETDITGLTADSRQVERDFLFAAIPGSQVDGRRFIPDALDFGAAAILSTIDVQAEVAAGASTILIADPEPRRQFAWMADRFFDAQPETQVAVTGTNGKTSVVTFVQQIWTALGFSAVSLGTLGIRGPGVDRNISLTTPDPVSLHRDLASLCDVGISHLAIEASSHGLDQFRLDGLRLNAAGFTNLSHDHIDYHGTNEAYLSCKLRLFGELVPPGGAAVLNADSDVYAAVRNAAVKAGLSILSYGSAAADIQLKSLTPRADGQRLAVAFARESVTVDLPLVGDFQAWNVLCALGLVLATGGTTFKETALALRTLKGVPGRLEHVGSRQNGAAVYVDYAHTPDALKAVLKALRPHTRGRLLVIFGCGGDRDPGKRSMMGQTATALADIVVVTDDNPRSEEPAAIRAAVLAASPRAIEIGDRRTAIRRTVASLETGDVLVVAGKGHEQGQIVGDAILFFDDAVIARQAIATADGLS